MKLLFSVLILLTGVLGFAQSNLSGRITTTENEALPGATIVMKGTSLGAISNENGEFLFPKLKNGRYQLNVSFIGYQPYSTEITLSKDLHLAITLQKSEVMTDEVFVYATRAGINAPVASSRLTANVLREKNIGQDIPYILATTPSFVSTSDAGAGVGYTGFRIRGTDANRINVTINGIPFNEAESHDVYWVDLPDITSSVETIEIQRGVGTSTQGAAAFGATINMQTTTLREEPYGEYSSSAGSFNTFKNTFSTGSGLLNNHFSFDARLSAITSDGFIDRAFTKMNSYYLSGGYYSGRSIVKLVVFSGKEKTYQAWNGVPSVRLNNDIDGMKRYEEHWLYSAEETAKMLASNPRTYNLYTYENETDNYRQDHYQLLYNQKFGPSINMNTALFYTHGQGYYEQFKKDQEFGDYGMKNFITDRDTITSTDLIRQKWLYNHFYGGTYSLNYKHLKSDITLGAGWNRYDGLHYGKVIWAEFMGENPKDFEWYRGSGLKTDFNIYLKYNVAISTQLSLYADLQYRNILHSIDGIDDDLRDLTQDHNYDFLNPKLGITFLPTSNSKAYLSWAVGNREPNRSNFTDADPNGKQPTFETLNDFEMGYQLSCNNFSAGANLYLMLYKNQLILTGEINDVGSAIMVNVDKSYRTGIELAAGVKILPTLSWNLNTTLSSNKIVDFTEYVDNWDTGGQDSISIGTTNIAFSPSVVANSVIDYEPIPRLKLSFISQYVGKQYIDNSSDNSRSLNAYLVNNLKLSYTIQPGFVKDIQIHLQVMNLFNEEYETNAWVYSYIYDGSRHKMDGYFPQAGIHFMIGANIKF